MATSLSWPAIFGSWMQEEATDEWRALPHGKLHPSPQSWCDNLNEGRHMPASYRDCFMFKVEDEQIYARRIK